jgi:hypothetical protein
MDARNNVLDVKWKIEREIWKMAILATPACMLSDLVAVRSHPSLVG